MILKALRFITLIPVIYLLMATVLMSFPFSRAPVEKSIDFKVLNTPEINQDAIIEKYYMARDDKKLFYRYLQGNTEKILILLHGSGSEGRYLLPLAEKIRSSLGFHVIVPDLRGHGRSALSSMGDINYLGQYEHDLEDLNKHLKQDFPGASITLGGHSSGAGLAVKYGGGTLMPFDGYLLLAPYLGYAAPTVKPNSGGWVQVAKKRYIGLSMFNQIHVTTFNHMPVIYFNRPENRVDALQAESYSYRLNESFSPQDYAQNLKSNHYPILVLVGTEDDAFYAEKFKPVFLEHAPHATVRLIENTKHLDLPNSEVAFKVMKEWLD